MREGFTAREKHRIGNRGALGASEAGVSDFNMDVEKLGNPGTKKKALSELAVEANYIESMVLPKEVNHAAHRLCQVARAAQATHTGAAEVTGSAIDG